MLAVTPQTTFLDSRFEVRVRPAGDERPESSRLALGAAATLRTDAHFTIAEGLFWAKAGDAALVKDFRESTNRYR